MGPTLSFLPPLTFGFYINLSPGFLAVPFIGYTAWPVAVLFLLLYLLVLIWAVRGRALLICAGCLVLAAPSALPFERLLGNELETISSPVFQMWQGRVIGLNYKQMLREGGERSERWKKLYENGPFTVADVLNRTELNLILNKVDELQPLWTYNLEAYPLPEFRLGDNLRVFDRPSLGTNLRARLRDRMVNAFHSEEIKLFLKMARAFEDVIGLERGAVLWEELPDSEKPGIQLQYPHVVFGANVFFKHTDGEGIDPERTPKGYDCSWDGKETVSAVLPLELPRAGGGLDWWLWDFSKEECIDPSSTLTDVRTCVAKQGSQKYVEGNMYFYSGPILHAISSWSINQQADPATSSAPYNRESRLTDRRVAVVSFYNRCLEEKTREPVWIMSSNPFYIPENEFLKLNSLELKLKQ
ncbi:hypothetical protein TrVE_jg4993 [Triparma verrucosa]|uniref:Uncharacterized protein n=1 Tax=Triparma verrucosa TaxID=1606542 RepID=A0A9W7CJN9_9STRA|nr:hypothetical protein TrVE_jg4993 [Triparma verrucosa]